MNGDKRDIVVLSMIDHTFDAENQGIDSDIAMNAAPRNLAGARLLKNS